jgi:hypothetical protein
MIQYRITYSHVWNIQFLQYIPEIQVLGLYTKTRHSHSSSNSACCLKKLLLMTDSAPTQKTIHCIKIVVKILTVVSRALFQDCDGENIRTSYLYVRLYCHALVTVDGVLDCQLDLLLRYNYSYSVSQCTPFTTLQ